MTCGGCRPFASAVWCERCVPATGSSGCRARIVPTATASCPAAEWMPPGMLPREPSRSARSSKRRISIIVSSHSTRSSFGRPSRSTWMSSAAAACASVTRALPGVWAFDSGGEAVEQLRRVASVERAVVNVECGEHRGPRLECASADDDPVANSAHRQERRLPAGDDPGELVDAEGTEVGERRDGGRTEVGRLEATRACALDGALALTGPAPEPEPRDAADDRDEHGAIGRDREAEVGIACCGRRDPPCERREQEVGDGGAH